MKTKATELILDHDDRSDLHHTTFGVGLDGAIYSATVLTGEDRRFQQQTFAKSRFDQVADCLVRKFVHGELVAECLVERQELVVNFVQPVTDGFLLVGARCHWSRGGAEKNAALYGWDGTLRNQFCLGDGIEDVRTIPDRSIWVSYFDEGVFGNFGWGRPPGPEPIGQKGLVRFDMQGQPRWEYDHREASTDMIVDAYAVNLVSKREIWIYFYSDFPIVRYRDKRYDVWSCDHVGARAIAVDQNRALLFGEYEHRQIAQVVYLGPDGHTEIAEAFRVTLPDGGPLEPGLVYGVGNELLLFSERAAYRLVDW